MNPVDFLKYYLSVESDKFDTDEQTPIADFAVNKIVQMADSQQVLDVLKKYHEVKPDIINHTQPA